MPAARTNLVIEQGTTWSYGWAVTYRGQPLDGGAWVARSQVRSDVESSTVLHTFAATINPGGAVVIAVTPQESSAWTWVEAVYDVEVAGVVDGAPHTYRVAQGRVRVSREVTR